MVNLIPFNTRDSGLLNTGFGSFQNMLDDFFADRITSSRSLAWDTFKIDVQANDKEYIVEAELPGVQKNELNIKLEEGRLNISVSKEDSVDEDFKNYIHRERRYSSMSRSVYLVDAASDGIKAKLEDGLLKIKVPKKEKPDNSIEIDID